MAERITMEQAMDLCRLLATKRAEPMTEAEIERYAVRLFEATERDWRASQDLQNIRDKE